MIKIAIDGPSGAGKSTIAKAVAKRLGYVYVDTGALYRTIGWAALSENLNCSDAQQIMPLLKRIQVDLTYENGVQKVLLNGTDVSTEIRLPQCSMSASAVSAIPAVR
ncbi:MAG: (d)CMP kinase, partial [Clostridia bacterium]|nr:(d)CMP kinase [Clostridia bacterium]